MTTCIIVLILSALNNSYSNTNHSFKNLNMKRTYYHGTSADNLESILKHGLSANENKLWSVSDDLVYLWCPEAIAASNDQQDETDEYKRDNAFRMASESAQFACATAPDCRLLIIEVEIDESEIESDNSSDNMESMGAKCIARDIQLHEIKKISISNDLSLMKGYFINMAACNEMSTLEFNKLELRIAEAFKKAEFYPEDIENIIQWDAVKMPKKKQLTSVK